MTIKGQTTALVFIAIVQAQTATAEREQLIEFHIPAQPLASALLQFAEMSGVNIFFKADITRNIESKTLSGRYSTQDALSKLLQNTHINYRFTHSHSITLFTVSKPLNTETLPAQPSADVTYTKPYTYSNIRQHLTPVVLEDLTINNLQRNRYSYSATGTDTAIMELPQSIQILPPALLDDQQVVTISESLNNVSGVTPRNPSISPNFEPTLIRGFASMQMIDGFYQNLNTGQRFSVFCIFYL